MRLFAAVVAACVAQVAASAGPVTYQGVLNDAGGAASDTYDMIFDLYTDGTPGGPEVIVATELVTNVVVEDGRFTVEIPFNPLAFNGEDRFLQIGCRPAGGGSFTTLLPRQLITDVPEAVHAEVADVLSLPAELIGFTTEPTQGVLHVENTLINSGTAIKAESPWSAITARAGDTSGAPVLTIAPAGLIANGEQTGVSGASASGVGVLGAASTGSAGRFINTSTSSANPALYARTPSTADDAFAIHGVLDAATAGSYSAAVRGESRATNGIITGIGVWGSHEGQGIGVYGTTDNGTGVRGLANSGSGVYGRADDGNAFRGFSAGAGRAGFFEINNTANEEAVILARTDSTQSQAYGVHAMIESTNPGSYSAAVRAENNGTGGLGIGVHATHDGSGWGVLGESVSGVGVYGSSASGMPGTSGVT